MNPVPALLVLEDGRSFVGRSFGADGTVVGEIVILTDFAAYQAALADPANTGKVLLSTFPHVGNTGWADDAPQAMRASGLVTRDPALRPSSWRSTGSLDEQLTAHGVLGVCDVDTRAITRHIRGAGTRHVAISTAELDPGALLAHLTDSLGRKDH